MLKYATIMLKSLVSKVLIAVYVQHVIAKATAYITTPSGKYWYYQEIYMGFLWKC